MFRTLTEKLQKFLEEYQVGSYTLQANVKLSPQVKSFLLEVSKEGGNGIITSVLRDSQPGGSYSNRSHQSGNKFDLKLDDIKNDYNKIADRVIPILRNNRCKELAFECLGQFKNNEDSKRIAEIIKEIILNKDNIIKQRVLNNQLIIWTDWGWKYSTFTHADICIQ